MASNNRTHSLYVACLDSTRSPADLASSQSRYTEAVGSTSDRLGRGYAAILRVASRVVERTALRGGVVGLVGWGFCELSLRSGERIPFVRTALSANRLMVLEAVVLFVVLAAFGRGPLARFVPRALVRR